MAGDELKGDDLLAEAAKVFDTPNAGPTQAPETTGMPPTAPSAATRPEDIQGEDDLFRAADQILGK